MNTPNAAAANNPNHQFSSPNGYQTDCYCFCYYYFLLLFTLSCCLSQLIPIITCTRGPQLLMASWTIASVILHISYTLQFSFIFSVHFLVVNLHFSYIHFACAYCCCSKLSQLISNPSPRTLLENVARHPREPTPIPRQYPSRVCVNTFFIYIYISSPSRRGRGFVIFFHFFSLDFISLIQLILISSAPNTIV